MISLLLLPRALSNCKSNPKEDFINGVHRTYYIGHRGSKRSNSCENTYAAYLGGAKAGYDGLETDIRVSNDGVFFCCHDNDLTRLTAYESNQMNNDVNNSNFNDIKDVLISSINTKNEKTPATTLCLYEDYLKVCKKYHLIPIIELKWTNGINSKDFSNIPALLEMIKKYNLEKSAFVMTSMKPCLEYIRSIDKNIHLQWLCMENITSGLDWAIKNNISIDVEYQYCTQEIVDKLHQNGLYINIWTLNDEAFLEKYIDMGVDFVTTDILLK